jgi:Ca2+/H+ antiporter, TMEM165/GDT1 family
VSLAVCAVCFALILPAELPDKTAVASLLLGTRNRPLPVFVGAAAAFAVHVTLAVAIGSALALLPRRPLDALCAAMFAAGALLVLRQGGRDEQEAQSADGPLAFTRVAAASFAVILVAEFGDLTQLVIANLAARYHSPLSVGLGSVLALWLVAGLAAAGGRGLVRVVPLRLLTGIAAAALAAMAVLSVISAVRA